MRGNTVVLATAAIVAAAACTSPEATRVGGGTRGADPGNRTTIVQMHEGSRPYHEAPRLITPYGMDDLAPAQQADRLSLRDRVEPTR
jgi:hypothetical protein